MAATTTKAKTAAPKVVVPNAVQHSVLETAKRRVIETYTDAKGVARARVLTAKGAPVPDVSVRRSAVDACIKRGWLNKDSETDGAAKHSLSDIGKKAAKVVPVG